MWSAMATTRNAAREAWSAQVVLYAATLTAMTRYQVWLGAGALALAGALLVPRLVGDAAGRPVRLRVAVAVLCALAAPVAIEARVGSGSELLLYSVNNITSGTDAQGEVTVRLSTASEKGPDTPGAPSTTR